MWSRRSLRNALLDPSKFGRVQDIDTVASERSNMVETGDAGFAPARHVLSQWHRRALRSQPFRSTRRGLCAPRCGRALMRPCPDAAVADCGVEMPVTVCTEPGIGEQKPDILA